MLDRMLGRFRRRRGGALESDDFIVDNNRINVAPRMPSSAIRSTSSGCSGSPTGTTSPIHPDATRLATRSLRLIGPSLRNDPEANRLFLDILTSRNAPEVVLRRMNEAGVLGRFIPDFGRIVAMMQFNMYHHYTVDEHLIRSIGVLAEIEAGRLGDEHPLVRPHHPCRSSNRRALYVALFLHDIAKGRPEDHSIAGAAHRPQARPAARPRPGRDRHRRLARRAPSPDVDDGAEPRPLGSGDDRGVRRASCRRWSG